MSEGYLETEYNKKRLVIEYFNDRVEKDRKDIKKNMNRGK